MVAASRRPLRRGRSIRAAGAAALSGRGGRRTVPWLRRRRVPALALVPDAAVRGGRASRLAGAGRTRRAALPPRRGPYPGRRPAELAGPPGAATDAGRLRVEPAYDAQRDPRRCRSPVRPGCPKPLRCVLAARVSRGGFPVRRLRRSGLRICAVGRDASLLGARRTIRGRSRNRGGRPDPRPRGTVAWRARSAAAGGDPPGDRATPVLDVIGNGAHRVSEIAGRLGKPASGLSKPLAS